jgi:hypothetical protein
MYRRGAGMRWPTPAGSAQANGYAFLTEMLFDAARLGLPIGEVIVFVSDRRVIQVSSTVLLNRC